jgi:hypothetical protein
MLGWQNRPLENRRTDAPPSGFALGAAAICAAATTSALPVFPRKTLIFPADRLGWCGVSLQDFVIFRFANERGSFVGNRRHFAGGCFFLNHSAGLPSDNLC